MSGPPFNNVDSAMYWAFEVVSRDIVDISSIYRRRDQQREHEADLDVWERHGQAGAIIGIAERHLDADQSAYVLARYGKVRTYLERIEMRLAAHLGTGAHPRRAINKVWLMHCGSPIGIKALCVDMGHCRTEKAVAFRRQLTKPLVEMYVSVHRSLEPQLLANGIVEYAHA